MAEFIDIKNRISLLGRAEYRYDRLTSDFAEHYLALEEFGYEALPELHVFREWLRHLQKDIRPTLLEAWRAAADRYGFALGDLIKVGDVELYAVRMSCYPLEDIVRVLGFGVKKDGKPSQASVDAVLTATAMVQKGTKSLDKGFLEPLFFEGTTRLANVREFLQLESAALT